MTDDERPLRRTRRRATAPQGAPREPVRAAGTTAPPAEKSAPATTSAPASKAASKAAPKAASKATFKAKKQANRGGPPRTADRGLHDLVGGGSSQVGLSRALRARDVNRPTDDDLATAERELSVVRRNWKPPS